MPTTRYAVRMKARIRPRHVSVAGFAVADGFDLGLCGDASTEGIVDIDDDGADGGHLEQPPFRRGIPFHGDVVVEMVPRQVGENRNVELHRRHAILLQRVRTDFHRHRGVPFATQCSEPALHGYRILGGQPGAGQARDVAPPDRAHIGRIQQRGALISDRCLAVRARDADAGQGGARIAEVTRGDLPLSDSEIAQHDIRDTGGDPSFGAHRRRTPGDGLAHMPMPVVRLAHAGEEQVARRYPPGIVGDAGHDRRAAGTEQLVESSGRRHAIRPPAGGSR